MKTNRIILPLILVLMTQWTVNGQQQSTMYFMNLPQSHFLNPALRSTNGVYIGLPAISGINFNFNNNFLNFGDVFRFSSNGDSIISLLHPDFNTDGFLKKTAGRNFINPDIGIQIFGLGFSAGKDLYIFLDVNERISGSVTLPGDLFKLALKGNESFVGDKIDFSSLDMGVTYYREVAAGFSKDFGDRLRIGARGRMLMGIATMSMENRNMSITVLDDYSHRMNTDATINISGPVTVVLKDDNTIDDILVDEKKLEDPAFYLSPDNFGLGIDLGAVYKFGTGLTLSAALNGLGYISWKRDITNLKGGNEFVFTGFDLSGVIKGEKEFDEIADRLLDSLKNSFTASNESKPFTTPLPPALTLAASYNVTPALSVGLVSNTLLKAGGVKTSMMLSANANLGSSLSAGISYTAINRSYDNLGLGIAFRAGPVQFYTIADKIPVMYNRLIINQGDDGDDLKLILPDKWNILTLRVGMNLVFGNKIRKKSDRPMIVITEVN